MGAVSAHAGWTYIGSFELDDGPYWGTNPPVYSGLGVAVMLYGGTESDYAISTVDSNPADINYSAWTDTWGIHPPVVSPEGYSVGTYYNEYGTVGSATSAWVSDSGYGPQYTDYVFSNTTPSPAAALPMLGGLIGLIRRRRAK